MKTLLIAALAAGAALTAAPANAQQPYYADHGDWDRRGERERRDPGYFGLFERDFGHINRGIRHGLSDGSFTRWEARQFRQELQRIQSRLDSFHDDDEFLSPWEVRDIQRRINRLQHYMHIAHRGGHAEQQYDFRDYSLGRYRDDRDDYDYDDDDYDRYDD